MNDEVMFELRERIGELNTYATGWSKEINLVCWNGGTAKLDIRDWNGDHTHMSRGITLYPEEAYKLMQALGEYFKKNPIDSI